MRYARRRMERLDIAVIGCGSAGPAAALLLHRAGHAVQLFERVPELLPVGAGFMLQPTGLDVLRELGLLEPVLERGAIVPRLYCRTRSGRRILDLAYAEVSGQYYGVGMHRATMLELLAGALRDDGIALHLDCGIDAIETPGHGAGAGRGDQATLTAGDARHGPFDLVIVCDGARSQLREPYGPGFRATQYPWGALWFIGADSEQRYDGRLFQVVEGARRMVGFLPTGMTLDDDTPLVSLFWSIELATFDALRAAGLAAWKNELLRLAPEAEPLADQIDDLDQLTLAAYMDVRMKPWHRGPVVFIGDCAHATSPQLGQGVNLALVDASILAHCVIDHAGAPAANGSASRFDRSSGDRSGRGAVVASALDAYRRARRHQLAYYQFTTRWLTPFFQSRSRALGWIRDIGFPMIHWLAPARRQMVRTMCGIKRGFVRRSMPLPRLALPAPPDA